MKKILLIIPVILLLVIIALYILPSPISGSGDLEKQDDFIAKMELPDTIERIAVRSAIGDSGGNGDYNTLRSVMLVRTELNKEDLEGIFVSLGFYDKGMERNWDYPQFVVREATNQTFNSPRDFRLEFEELRNVDTFNGYFFIEFIK